MNFPFTVAVIAVASASLVGCSGAQPDQLTKTAAYAECMSQLERVKHHPEEQFYWNRDDQSTVTESWCEAQDIHAANPDGMGTYMPHLSYVSPRNAGLELCPNGVCTIHPSDAWQTYPLATENN